MLVTARGDAQLSKHLGPRVEEQKILSTEILVAGGGPAGLAAAIAAAREGYSVTVADHAIPPIDKPCGEGIMPDGLAALENLGVHLARDYAGAFRGIRFLGDGRQVEAQFVEGQGLGIRRTSLHRLLMERAAEEGVSMRWGASVTLLGSQSAQVGNEAMRFRWLVCADGQNSRMRKAAGLDLVRVFGKRYGFRQHFRVRPWSDYVEVHWSDCGQLYITPTGQEELCVAFITSRPDTRFSQVLREFPQVEQRLRGCEAMTREQGSITSTARLRSVSRGRVALLGEASGSIDAVTGEGLSTAFRQARVLVDAIKQDDLALYEKTHRKIMRRPQAMSRLLLLMDRTPAVRRRVLHALSADPAVFSRLLQIHTGAVSPVKLGIAGALSFGWGFMTA
ncbi:MAG TPA: FAD-dependent monooxygenase [Terriglobales bacterium]|nr:FAD-dependent monooxygenase [Terriglobales bacterium]